MLTSTTVIYAFFAGIIPALIWLWFWLREDAEHKEPRALIVAIFLAGMATVYAAGMAEKYFADFYTDQSIRYIAWAAIEEILKLVIVASIALHSRANDEPIDAMIYFITAALGFAAFETTFFIMNTLYHGGTIMETIVNNNLRFMGAELIHVASSAMIGFGLGYTFYRGFLAKLIGLIVGLAAAVGLHAAFNLTISSIPPDHVLQTISWFWAAIVILIILFEEVKVVRPRLLK